MKKRVLSILLAACLIVSCFTLVAGADEASGCGRPIVFIGTQSVGGTCNQSNCVSGVWIEMYSCSPACAPGYNGYVMFCNSGHYQHSAGKVSGTC